MTSRIAIVENPTSFDIARCPIPTQHCLTLTQDDVDGDIHVPVRLLLGLQDGDEFAYKGEAYTVDQTIRSDTTFSLALGCMLERAVRRGKRYGSGLTPLGQAYMAYAALNGYHTGAA